MRGVAILDNVSAGNKATPTSRSAPRYELTLMRLRRNMGHTQFISP